MQKIRVSIYEDNSGLKNTLSLIISQSKDFELAGAFDHCLNVVKNTKEYSPNVIIMDIDMPGKTGIDAVRELKPLYPDVEVIMNTVFDDDERIFSAIKAGATGYLLKKHSLATLLNSIRDVYHGGAPMSPYIARRVLQMPMEKSGLNSEQKFKLTQKESQILILLAKGLSYKMVADQLFMSLDTVRTHVKKIYDKLHVHSVTEAIHKVFIDKV